MLPELSIVLLERQMAGEEVASIDVGVAEGVFSYAFSGPGAVSEQSKPLKVAEPVS
jgi:type VI secretion system protein VasG